MIKELICLSFFVGLLILFRACKDISLIKKMSSGAAMSGNNRAPDEVVYRQSYAHLKSIISQCNQLYQMYVSSLKQYRYH